MDVVNEGRNLKIWSCHLHLQSLPDILNGHPYKDCQSQVHLGAGLMQYEMLVDFTVDIERLAVLNMGSEK